MALGFTQMALISGPQVDSQAFVLVDDPGDLGVDIKELPIDTWVKLSGYEESDYDANPAILRMAGMPNTEDTQAMYRQARRSLHGPVTWGRIDRHDRNQPPNILSVRVNRDRPQPNLTQGLAATVKTSGMYGSESVAWSLYERSLGVSATRAAQLLLDAVQRGWNTSPSQTSNTHIYRVYNEPTLFASLTELLGATSI